VYAIISMVEGAPGLKHYDTSRNVVGSIPDVSGLFY
jgi:hypothetical protein